MKNKSQVYITHVFKCCNEGWSNIVKITRWLKDNDFEVIHKPSIHTRAKDYKGEYGVNQPPIAVISTNNITFEIPLNIHWKQNLQAKLNWRNNICTK